MKRKTVLSTLPLLLPLLISGCGGAVKKDNIKMTNRDLSPACICRKAEITGGDGSRENPFILKSKNRDYAVDCQLRYISTLKCDNQTSWQIVNRTFISESNSKFRIEKIEISCPAGSKSETIYFAGKR